MRTIVGRWIGPTVVGTVLGLKFGLPLLYLRFPFAAGWTNFLLDSVDGDILVPAGLPEPTYQTLDKAADWVAYVFMYLWSRDTPIHREMAGTFVLRTVGQALFFLTRNELAFFYFPNLVEPLFLVYVTMSTLRNPKEAEATYRRRFRLIWALILLYKLQDEWITHVANIDRTTAVKRMLGL